MISWLVQSLDDCPDLNQGAAPVGILSTGEQAKLATLTVAKRRRDWLLGRWTAKRLLQTVCYQRDGIVRLLDTLEVLNDPDGVPVVGDSLPACSLSISHSGGAAFCALIERRAWPIGCDIERIEPRSDAFVRDYLTPDEIASIPAAPPLRDLMITAMWSAKESALKALHLGLSVDSRAVTCLINFQTGPAWNPLTLRLDALRLRARLPLAGWCRTSGGFVLTIVSGLDSPGPLKPEHRSGHRASYPV